LTTSPLDHFPVTQSSFIETGLSGPEYAARHGVTPQTVSNWIRKKIIPAEGPPWVIDPKEADPRLAAYKSVANHGGKRKGGGRKPGRGEPEPDYGASPILALAKIDQLRADKVKPEGAIDHDFLLYCTEDLAQALVHYGDRVGVVRAQLENQKLVQDNRRRYRENAVAEGRLIPAAAAADAAAEMHARAKARLESLPTAAAREIAAAAWISKDRIDEAVDLIRAAGCDADTGKALRSILDRPAGLDADILSVLEHHARRVCEEISV
jgi:hypothetical protein